MIIAATGTVCLTNAKNKKKNYEAVIAASEIHGYQVELVYISEEKLPDKKKLSFGMYQGAFELRTRRDQKIFTKYPVTFDFTDTLSYPQEGFELAVKDYDGDGNADDFALGQGQHADPYLGNFMSYQIYTVDNDGGIARYEFSEDKKSLLTVPSEYSKNFKCKNGKIIYDALGENGVEKQSVNVVRLMPVTTVPKDMQPLQNLMTAIETTMPELIVNEIKEKGCWRLLNGTYCLANAEINDDISMRLDFTYEGTKLKQYVSKEYGFVDNMPENRINMKQAKNLVIAFASAFLDKEIDKNELKSDSSYSGYDNRDYATFMDSNNDTFLVQLSKNIVIKYEADNKQEKEEETEKETEYAAENNSFYFDSMNVTIKLPENKTWIQDASASMEDDIGIVTYYDAIAEMEATLRFGKQNQEEMLGFANSDPDNNEVWSFFPGKQEKFINVQFYAFKNSTSTIVLSWEYNKLHFFISAEFTDPALTEKNTEINTKTNWESLAKTAAYIAENYYHALCDAKTKEFSDNDIKAAKTAVKEYFKETFPDCKLQKLWFDEEIYRNTVTSYCDLYGKDDIIILLSDFYVSKDCKLNSLEKDSVYPNFHWILSKNKNSDWNIETYGY